MVLRTTRILAAALLALSLPATGLGKRAPTIAAEAEIKAVYLHKFVKYVSWPEEPPSEAFLVGVVGEDTLVDPLQGIAAIESAENLPMVVIPFAQVPEEGSSEWEELARCQILFLDVDPDQLDGILALLGDRPVLTVADREDFAARGVGINFFVAEGRLRFEVNRDAVERAGITISSQLLNLAEVVH